MNSEGQAATAGQDALDIRTLAASATPPGLATAVAAALLYSLWFAALTGLADWAWMAIGQLQGKALDLLHDRPPLSWHAIWLVPLGTWLIFLPPALLAGLAYWRWPRHDGRRLIVLAPLFLALLHLILVAHLGLYMSAAIILALGLAYHPSRWLAASPRFDRLVRVSLVPLLLVPAVGAIYLAVARQQAEQQALAGLPPADSQSPSVLLVVLDTVRMENTPLDGYGRDTTPVLTDLAAQGVSYQRAIATSPWTFPTHASLFTGRWPSELASNWRQRLDDRYPTLAEFLSRRGYLTGGFVGNQFYCNHHTGLDRGFHRYQDYRLGVGKLLGYSTLSYTLFNSRAVRSAAGFHDHYDRKPAWEVNAECLAWLDRQEQRPFFIFVNYYDAHHPYVPAPAFSTLYGPEPPDQVKAHFLDWGVINQHALPSEVVQFAVNAYDGGIAQMDHYLGRLLDGLRQRGRLDNTIIIVVSDHGEQFGEHGLFVHANSLYSQLVHVPLVLVYPPKVPAGLIRPEIISLRDLPATVLDLMAVADHPFPGGSLARDWQGPAAARPVLAELGSSTFFCHHGQQPDAPLYMRSIFLDGLHYIKNDTDGKEELYDFMRDPRELRDLAPAADLRRFRQALDALSPPPAPTDAPGQN